ncbi:MAG: substrate-binding domain-containing protein [Anaerolineae bacterium]
MRKVLFVILLVTLMLAAGCVPPATPVPPAAGTAAATAAVEPVAATAVATDAATLAPTEIVTATTATTEAPAAGKLILATTTSTADSGLLDAILPDFEAKYNATVDVIAVGTGQALEIGGKGDADVLLVHSRKGEDKFVADGNAKARYDVMYNDFVVVGPTDDPAGIGKMTIAKDAFQAIADAEAAFASRGDESGTNTKELAIWASIPFTPTADMAWYNALGQGMGDTLVFANEQGAYTLTDRGTFLAMQDKLPDLQVLVGGANLADNKDKVLLNPYGVLMVDADTHPGVNVELATQFQDWLLSVDTQKVIGAFGVDKYGQPLFYPSSEELKATHAVTIVIGNQSKTFTLDEMKALPVMEVKGYEAIGHKKGPLGVNDWAGASLKELMLAVDPTVGDSKNSEMLIVATASDGWKSTLRWNQVFGEPRGGQALADSYGCSECHGYFGEGTAPAGKQESPALAGKAWSAEKLAGFVREKHGGINPYTPEQLPDADLAELAIWFTDPTAAAPDDASSVSADKVGALLAFMRNGTEMKGRDGLIQMIMPMDKYSSRYAHWVDKVELVAPTQ